MNRFEAPQSYGRRERFPEVATGGPQYQIMLAMECAKHFLSSAASRDVPVCHYKAPTVLVAASCTSCTHSMADTAYGLKQKIRAYIPFGVLSRGFGEGPEKKTFKYGRNRFPGPTF